MTRTFTPRRSTAISGRTGRTEECHPPQAEELLAGTSYLDAREEWHCTDGRQRTEGRKKGHFRDTVQNDKLGAWDNLCHGLIRGRPSSRTGIRGSRKEALRAVQGSPLLSKEEDQFREKKRIDCLMKNAAWFRRLREECSCTKKGEEASSRPVRWKKCSGRGITQLRHGRGLVLVSTIME